MRTHTIDTPQKTGAAAIGGIIAAVVGFVAIFTGHPYIGLFLQLAAIVLGTVGFLMAASPRVSGGIMSIIAIVLGILGVGMSIVGMIGVIVF